jgi:ASC-1-like (ASCH) protein
MAVIRKKIPPEYYDLVAAGKKRFELRVADFEAKEGDTLLLEEWDNEKGYTGRAIKKKVGYVLKFALDTFGQEELIKEKGLLAIQLEDSDHEK